MTDFPPSPGFDGYQSRRYDDDGDGERYDRACTAEEVAILEAGLAAAGAAERAQEESLRDAWFALLRSEAEPAVAEAPVSGPSPAGTAEPPHPPGARLCARDDPPSPRP